MGETASSGRGAARAFGGRLLAAVGGVAIRVSLVATPRFSALLLRRAFAQSGAQLAQRLEPLRPDGVAARLDVRFGDRPDAVLDLYCPGAIDTPLPLLVWVHGGAWLGGSKEELRAWLETVASRGYVVAAPSYPLAPGHRYPTPIVHVGQALAHLVERAPELGIDAERIALGGDSAGAQIAAQLAALATTPGYSDRVGVSRPLDPERLRCVVLACGPYDLGLARSPSTEAGRILLKTVLWSYSGTRGYLDDPTFATFSVTDNLGAAFPPAFLTVGDVDPLRDHSELIAGRLAALGVEVDTLFFPEGHEPPLRHEFQFELGTEAGQLFLERLVAFLARYLRDAGEETARA